VVRASRNRTLAGSSPSFARKQVDSSGVHVRAGRDTDDGTRMPLAGFDAISPIRTAYDRADRSVARMRCTVPAARPRDASSWANRSTACTVICDSARSPNAGIRCRSKWSRYVAFVDGRK